MYRHGCRGYACLWAHPCDESMCVHVTPPVRLSNVLVVSFVPLFRSFLFIQKFYLKYILNINTEHNEILKIKSSKAHLSSKLECAQKWITTKDLSTSEKDRFEQQMLRIEISDRHAIILECQSLPRSLIVTSKIIFLEYLSSSRGAFEPGKLS